MRHKQYKHGSFSHLDSDVYLSMLQELSSKCEEQSCFIFEGRIFAGDKTQTIKQYLLENPSKSFYVWLIDSGIELTQS